MSIVPAGGVGPGYGGTAGGGYTGKTEAHGHILTLLLTLGIVFVKI